jgi:hypothetical protein
MMTDMQTYTPTIAIIPVHCGGEYVHVDDVKLVLLRAGLALTKCLDALDMLHPMDPEEPCRVFDTYAEAQRMVNEIHEVVQSLSE